jgi:membrane-bound serine protease (ClpP class)
LFQINPNWFRIDPYTITITIIVVVGFVVLAIYYGIRAHRGKVGAGKEELIGRTAEASTALEPKGTVFIEGERWAAISDKGMVEAGEEVIITKVEGLKLRVVKKE